MQREHLASALTPPKQACHVPVWRVCADGWQRSTVDVLVEETPVALVYNGISHAVMLATPTELDDLALGFSLSEGILDDPSQLYGLDIEHSADGISIMMEIASRQFHSLKDRRRALAGRTGCGLCGVDSLDGVARCQTPVSRGAALAASRIFAAVKALERHQPLRQTTGAAHAAAWVDADGVIHQVREDVGRHNALDKLIGARARLGADNREGFALVSSRASYEMVQKTALAGMGALVALSAPTALAVRLAESSGLTLVGFARQHSLVVYAGASHVLADMPLAREGDSADTLR